MISRIALVAVASASVGAGCGLVFQGTSQGVRVITDPPGAMVSVDGKQVSAPGVVEVTRREWTVFRATKEGYVPACQLIGARRNRTLAVLDSIPLGLGWAFDRPTEALRQYPSEVHFMLAPVSPDTHQPFIEVNDQAIILNRRQWHGMCVPPAAIQTARGVSMTAPIPGLVTVRQEPRTISWNGITVGKTTRDDIEQQYGPGDLVKGGTRYVIDNVSAVIAYDSEDAVQSIRVKPPVVLREQSVVAAYGKPTHERRSDVFRRLWAYPEAGMTVEFAPDNATVSAIEYHEAKVGDGRGHGEPPPIINARPALRDIPHHQANILLALSQTGRSFNWVSTAEEYQTAQQVLQTASAEGIVSSDETLQRCVQNILDRLATVTPATPYPWVIRIIQNEHFNALNAGGGVIMLNTGLLRHLETEAQLAYVVGHEMGHQLKGHVVAQESKKRLAGVLIAAGVGVARDPQLAAVAGNIAAGATLAAFSRTQEIEADRIGLNILNEAGYDPREAVKAAQIMVQVDARGGAPGMFSTHPDPVERLANVQGWLSTAWDADYSGRIVSTKEFEAVKATYR